MQVRFHRSFEKSYVALPKKSRLKVDNRLCVFRDNEFNPILNNHPLRGKYDGCRSINITGSLRAIYKYTGKGVGFFIKIGTHSKLYK